MPTPNIPLLTRVRDAIAAEPERLYMNTFFHYSPSTCRTSACVAGWAITLAKAPLPDPALGRQIAQAYKYDFFAVATSLLGLTDRQAFRLFYHSDWPEGEGENYENAPDAAARAAVAVRVLDRFIAKHQPHE